MDQQRAGLDIALVRGAVHGDSDLHRNPFSDVIYRPRQRAHVTRITLGAAGASRGPVGEICRVRSLDRSTRVRLMPSTADTDTAEGRVPRTYLGWGVAATVLCFLPLGLIVVLQGLRTNRALADGRMDDAARTSRSARRWLVVTIVVGVLVDLVIAAALLLLGAFST
ncbi:MAG: hypothetical protein GC156_05620 [Actinomycetales bacterium]|nr:hypothetical protein [Actinomycetales bacterium]